MILRFLYRNLRGWLSKGLIQRLRLAYPNPKKINIDKKIFVKPDGSECLRVNIKFMGRNIEMDLDHETVCRHMDLVNKILSL